jgi:hypothetical protein
VSAGALDELAEVRWASLSVTDDLLPGVFDPVRDHLGQGARMLRTPAACTWDGRASWEYRIVPPIRRHTDAQ